MSIACWGALAVAAARAVRVRIWQLVTLATVLAFSLSFAVIRWDRLLLSESLSISLMAAVAAAWLELVRSPRRTAIVAVLVTNLLWVFARDTNAYLTLLSALPALVWVLRPGRLNRRWPAVLTVGLVAIFAASTASALSQEAQLRRNERPLLHVVGQRVLHDPQKLRFFRAHGMPAPTPLVRRRSNSLAAIGRSVRSDPRTEAVLDWVRGHGRTTLALYIVTHPVETLRSVKRDDEELLSGVRAVRYHSPHARRALPAWLAGIVYPIQVRGILVWLAFASLAALGAALVAGPRRAWLVAIGLILLEIPQAVIVYHGDTLEIARHAIQMAIMLRLGILLLAVLAVGALVERLAPGGREPPARAQDPAPRPAAVA